MSCVRMKRWRTLFMGTPQTRPAREAILDALRFSPQLHSTLTDLAGGRKNLAYWFTRELERHGLAHKRVCPGRNKETVWILNTARRAA